MAKEDDDRKTGKQAKKKPTELKGEELEEAQVGTAPYIDVTFSDIGSAIDPSSLGDPERKH